MLGNAIPLSRWHLGPPGLARSAREAVPRGGGRRRRASCASRCSMRRASARIECSKLSNAQLRRCTQCSMHRPRACIVGIYKMRIASCVVWDCGLGLAALLGPGAAGGFVCESVRVCQGGLTSNVRSGFCCLTAPRGRCLTLGPPGRCWNLTVDFAGRRPHGPPAAPVRACTGPWLACFFFLACSGSQAYLSLS